MVRSRCLTPIHSSINDRSLNIVKNGINSPIRTYRCTIVHYIKTMIDARSRADRI